jgi:hypothetical protein
MKAQLIRLKLSATASLIATLDELHRALDGHFAFDGEQEMKVIGHDYEIVQPEFVLRAIVIQDAQEQSCGPIGLKEVLLVPCRGCNEKRASPSFHVGWVGAAGRDGHKTAAKADLSLVFVRHT